jgi:hypothetical protein
MVKIEGKMRGRNFMLNFTYYVELLIMLIFVKFNIEDLYDINFETNGEFCKICIR